MILPLVFRLFFLGMSVSFFFRTLQVFYFTVEGTVPVSMK